MPVIVLVNCQTKVATSSRAYPLFFPRFEIREINPCFWLLGVVFIKISSCLSIGHFNNLDNQVLTPFFETEIKGKKTEIKGKKGKQILLIIAS